MKDCYKTKRNLAEANSLLKTFLHSTSFAVSITTMKRMESELPNLQEHTHIHTYTHTYYHGGGVSIPSVLHD